MQLNFSIKHHTLFALSTCIGLTALALPTSAAGFQIKEHAHNHQLLIPIAQNAAQQDKAEAYVSKMTAKAIGFLSDDQLSQEEKTKEFKKFLDEHFDMRSIARFALGRYWRSATPAQQKEYVTLFNDMIVVIYSRRFADYKGQDIKITASRPEGKKDVLVSSMIQQNNGPEVQVDWRLRPGKSGFKVIDIVVAGVSMALTQRSDFASVIQRGGGDVQVLLAHLQQK